MHYAISVNFEGRAQVNEETGLCQLIGLAGSGGPPESTDDWRIVVETDWPIHEIDAIRPATIQITGPFGGSLWGACRHGGLSLVTDGGGRGRACMLNMDFEVTASSGRFAGSRGTINVTGTVFLQDAFLLTVDLVLEAPKTAWLPPNSGLLTADELASGASHVASQSRGQHSVEAATDASLHRTIAGQEQPIISAPGQAPSMHRHQDKQGGRPMEQREQQRHNPPGVTSGSPEDPPSGSMPRGLPSISRLRSRNYTMSGAGQRLETIPRPWSRKPICGSCSSH